MDRKEASPVANQSTDKSPNQKATPAWGLSALQSKSKHQHETIPEKVEQVKPVTSVKDFHPSLPTQMSQETHGIKLTTNMSPERQNAHERIGGKIVVEQQAKLAVVCQENERLQKAYRKKKKEKEKAQFNTSIAKSQFIEIMRGLTRIKEDFN